MGRVSQIHPELNFNQLNLRAKSKKANLCGKTCLFFKPVIYFLKPLVFQSQYFHIEAPIDFWVILIWQKHVTLEKYIRENLSKM